MQDYPAIEHIIIDGASTDGTQEVFHQYPHLKWVSEPDRGQSDALNKGFRLSQGEIIGWLNADDTYRPRAISQAVEYFQAHPDVDLVYTDVQVIDENDQPLRLAKAEPFSLPKLLISNFVKQPTVFMRKRVLDTLGGVKENLHYVMDHEFWLRAGMSFNLQYLPDVVFANFRYCKGTKSYTNVPGFHQEWIGLLTDFLEYPGLNDEFRLKVKRARQETLRQYYLTLMVEASKNGKQVEVLSHFKKALSCDMKSLFKSSIWKLFFRVLFKRTTAQIHD